MNIHAEHIIIVLGEVLLCVELGVQHDSQGGRIVHHGATLQILDIVAAILGAVPMHVIQLQVDEGSLTLIQGILVVVGGFPQGTQPRLHCHKLVSLVATLLHSKLILLLIVLHVHLAVLFGTHSF